MSNSPVQALLDGPVARLFLARPEVRNAFDGDTVRELTQAVIEWAARADVRVIVLGGQGSVFSAGADLDWMRRVAAFSGAENVRDTQALAALFDAVDRSPKPVVARVHGAALGGGAGLVAAADIAVAAEGTQFGFTEVRLGLVPAVISPWVVARIGVTAARELFLTGERFDAQQARAIGLVRHVVPAEELDAAVDARVRELLQAAPGAITAAKALLRAVSFRAAEDVRDATASLIAERRASPEGQEGLRAFLEKRKPRW
jgi:methylglutaconyl-CoA hydratase